MTSDFLAKLYAEVVKVRPEAEVPDRGILRLFKRPNTWIWASTVEHVHAQRMVDDEDAEAIILARWISMLPIGGHLEKRAWEWQVSHQDFDGEVVLYENGATPIEAVAEYLKSTGTEGGG